MRQVIGLAALLLACAPAAEAQRYLPGMRGLEAVGGMVEGRGYYLHGGYSQYTRGKNRWALAAEYLQRRFAWETGAIPLEQLTVEAGFYKLLFGDAGKSIFFAAGVSALTGYETVNRNRKQLPNGAVIGNADRWLYGIAAAVELEYYVDDRYVFLATIKQRAGGGSSVGLFHTQLGVGVKYILE
ncbi:MAG: conjugal transfer protein TraO [Prevotellaceae bacterium]|jgi:hypothetical protein|nr:conjugal transfer protein TraO [Prevotellaceae bacterium]